MVLRGMALHTLRKVEVSQMSGGRVSSSCGPCAAVSKLEGVFETWKDETRAS